MKTKLIITALLLAGLLTACEKDTQTTAVQPTEQAPARSVGPAAGAAQENARFDIYADVLLTADLSQLSENQKQMIGLLIEAAEITDDIFWQQVWGNRDELLNSIEDPRARRFAVYNYGPWDRLAADQPFIESFGPRPPGARFYPEDMSKEEFEAWQQEGKDGLYSIVRRDSSGNLELMPYSKAFETQIAQIAGLLVQASSLAEDQEFAAYLKMRAAALQTDDYQASDMAWMDMKNNPIELVIGPIETYQDALFGYRAAFETFVLIKDQAWSERLARFAKYMPELQKGLPVDEAYKAEMPGSDADLNAYDLAYCAGDCNSGSKTIAINLPNDEEVQLAKGTRRLQIKNSMLAKFNQILIPIANELIAEDQRGHITFDAFFGNTMFHEVAHGLGIKTTLDGAGTVRQALKEHASALEEGKADILGLYMVQKLREMGEITEGELMDNYVTFLAGIFRSVRFGASSAHGRANMIRFNYFSDAGAFSRDPETGAYRVNITEFEQAIKGLSNDILVMQGDGNYDTVAAFVAEMGNVGAQLQADLDRLTAVSIPVDIVYQQGKDVLGLQPAAQNTMGGRIVVKVGSQVLCDTQGTLNRQALANLVEQLADLLAEGWQVLLVSSGAVAAGKAATAGLQRLADPVARKQVMAATGQVRLMETYRALFERKGLTVAQILATKSDFQTRRHYLNMRGCIEALLNTGIVPIINENDVVSVTELMFTDNDELAGLLAGMVDAELLCLLTTVPGVYDGDPEDPNTRCIECWDDARYQVNNIISQATSRLGRGGMHNKLAIARKVAKLGTEVVIADGTDPGIIGKIIAKQPVGTRFPVSGEASPAKRWLASADGHASGSVIINQGAMETLLDSNRLASLLPVGIVEIEGHFDRGDVIRILGPDRKVVACGRADYDHSEAKKRLGQRGHKPLVHYDYLYLLV